MSQSSIKMEPEVKLESGTATPTLSNTATSVPPTSSAGEWNVIPLKACNAEELQDTRHHILKFHTKQDVNVMNNFKKPVRLHRKDPQNIQFQLSRQEMDRRRHEKEAAKAAAEADQDLEMKSIGSAARGDSLESGSTSADMSQVAPDGGARRHRRNLFKRKTKQVHMMDENKRKLRYEEYYPWVIEDYTGDNVYVGSYEAGSTESTHVLFVFDKNCFKMVPAEKVYKFTPRNKYATLTLEEAEARMEKNSSAPRWLMKHMDEGGERSDMRFRRGGSEAGGSMNVHSGSSRMRTVQGASHDRDSDHDDLDFEEEFADDEEAPIMDGDEEENKLSEKKIKKEMLKAAHLHGQSDDGDDSDDDLNDLFEVEKSRKVDKEGKKLRKVLNKTEGAVYESDNEESNPYVSQSDLESNDDSEPEVKVKTESTEGLDELSNGIPKARTVFISKMRYGTVVISATKEFLRQFPHGEWNPNIRKRSQDFEEPSSLKKTKHEDTSIGAPDLNDSGLHGELVTTQEVLNIVRQNPLTTKELLLNLKTRIGTHKDNKVRIIQIVKSNLKLVDGKLQLKE